MAGKSLFRDDVPFHVIKSYFMKYDRDGSQNLEKSECIAMLQDDMGLDEKQAEVCFMLIDKDGSKEVSLKEFAEWFRSPGGFKVVDNPKRYAFVRSEADAFKKYDKDGSGVINKSEFRELLVSGNKNYSRCSDEEIAQAMRSVDKDGSGAVSFSEYLAWAETRNANCKK